MAFYIKQGNTGPAILKQLLDSSGTPLNLTGASVRFSMATVAGVLICSRKVAAVFSGTVPGIGVVTAADGWVRYPWVAADTATAGECNAEFEATLSDGTIESVPNYGYESVIVTAKLA